MNDDKQIDRRILESVDEFILRFMIQTYWNDHQDFERNKIQFISYVKSHIQTLMNMDEESRSLYKAMIFAEHGEPPLPLEKMEPQEINNKVISIKDNVLQVKFGEK